MTQGQWARIHSTDGSAKFTEAISKPFRPVVNVNYNDIRGAPTAGIDWPDSGTNVSSTSFMGRLRTAVGGRIIFDLPTEAQWEYACRAGTSTYYNDGIFGSPSEVSNAQMDVLGRYMYNGGFFLNAINVWESPPNTSGPELGTAIVGSYLPNAWGLYDMHGNVWEWCADRHSAALFGGSDPQGPVREGAEFPDHRVVRGGSWGDPASITRSTHRNRNLPVNATYYNGVGFRVAAAIAQ